MEETTNKAADSGSQPSEERATQVNSIIPQIPFFIKLLYGDNPPGWLTIWTPNKKSYWFEPNDLDNITRVCEELRQNQDVYFGLALRKENLGMWQRGDSNAINALPGFWIEIDCKGGFHKAGNLPTLKEAAKLIKETFSLDPSALVHSGGGLHTYYLFDQLLIIDDEADRKRAHALLSRFQQLFIQAAMGNGWKVDNTSDLARVLRVPGTYNRKSKPVMVQIKGAEDKRRYTLEQMEAAIANAESKLDEIRKSQQEVVSATAIQSVPRKYEGDGQQPSASMILSKCGFIKHCAEDAASLTEPEWYKMVSIMGRTDMGEDLIHDLSRPYVGYSEKETDKKIKHALEASAPYTCERIQFDHGDEWCKGCKFNRKVKSPIALGFDRVGEAKRTISEAIKRATNGDVGAPLETQVVGALALIESLEPAEYARLKAELKNAKVPLTEINKLVRKERQRERLRVVSPGEATPNKTAGDFLSDCPYPSLIVPEVYTVNEDGVYRRQIRNEGKDNQSVSQVMVSFEPIIITGLYRDINTNQEALRISWKRSNRWFSQIVDRDVALNVRQIVNLIGKGFPVTSSTAAEVVSYLHVLESINIKHDNLPIAFVTSQLGWQSKDGAKGFLWGRTLITPTSEMIQDLQLEDINPGEWRDDLITFRGSDVGDEQIADGFHARGTIEEWMEGIRIASDYQKVMLAFYTAFVPPMLQILNCDNFILEFARRSSTGKSVAQRIAASTMGNPDEKTHDSVFHTWSGSKVWLGRASSILTGLPLIMDDTKQAQNKEFVAKAIYSVVGGKDVGRGTVKGLGITRTWRTVMISSGEHISTSFTPDGGTKGRLLAITSLPFNGDGPAERALVEKLDLIVKMNYGHAFPLFMQWLMQQKDNWSTYEAEFRKQVQNYASKVTGSIAGRLAKYAAAIDVTAALVHAAFQDIGHPLPFVYQNPFRNGLFEEIAIEAEDATGEEEALRDIFNWARSNETSFYGRHLIDPNGDPRRPNGGWLGRWDKSDDWTAICFNRHSLLRFFVSFGKDATAAAEIFKNWKDRGWLDIPKGQKGYQKFVSVNGEKDWYIVVKREAFDEL